MRKKSVFILLVIMLIVSSISLSMDTSKAEAFTAANATTAMNSFKTTFYNTTKKYFYTNSDQAIHTHAHGPESGLYTDYWWEAQIWETVMDAYVRTADSSYLTLIDDIYDGFNTAYPDWSTNTFNDDIGWWALASIRAYEITGETRFKTRAKAMFDQIWLSWSSDFGGGIWWNTTNFLPQKNVATNANAAMIAVRLYHAYSDSTYLTKANQLFNWVDSTLYAGNGYIYDQYRQGVGLKDWEFTYDNGIFAGAALALYLENNDSTYLKKATDSIDWVLNNMAVDGKSLLYEGVDDIPAFKMIFARNVRHLIDQAGQTQYEPYLKFNATQAWNHRRTSDGIIGPDWTLTPDSSFIQSSAATAGVAILFLSAPDNITGTVVAPGPYEAENAKLNGLQNEANANEQAGYSGRGYVAGWNTDATSVIFPVNALAAGNYNLTFRYSAGGGDAKRKLKVNGAVVKANQTFQGTGTWGAWDMITINTTLAAGTNQVELLFDSSAGSTNYLNLDKLNVTKSQLYEAELATHTGLPTESTNSGYTGTGYVAGWNSNGTSVGFTVNADLAGYYNLTFRYAGGAGASSRYLTVNGVSNTNNLAFASTGSWTSYSSVTVKNVYLNSGSNTLSLIYDSTKGSANYLNLDSLLVDQEFTDTLIYQAEAATLHSLTAESTYKNYTGTGYVAGWNANGQSVDFNVKVDQAGSYDLILRYAGGAGAASRYLSANGVSIANNLSFPTTGSWSNYGVVTVNNVTLNSGSNTITLAFDSTKSNSNYLNLDALQVVQHLTAKSSYQAESATLHSVSIESTNSGYTGSGYVAAWNGNSQWVDFTVTVDQPGYYNLTFRNAAGSGAASRYLYINGAANVNNLAFPSTGNWTTYKGVTVNNVFLNSGSNTISLIFDTSKGSTNYLNLDSLQVWK